jgi:hypothetical protein
MKPRFGPNHFFVLLAIVCTAAAALATAPAASAADDPATYPTDFLEAAKAFANAPVTDRYSEAYALNKKIPRAPRMNAGNFSNRRGKSRNRDRNNPTFVLHEADLPNLLGTARYTNSTAYGYPAKKDSCLWVFIQNGQVVDSTLSADKPPIFATNLLETSRAFRDAPATNRLNKAQALQNILPTSPVTTGSAVTDSYDRGCRFVYKDADDPTFVLREGDIARLLGRPDYSDPECYAYPVINAEKKETDFLIYFYNGFVVGSAIEDAPNPTPTK